MLPNIQVTLFSRGTRAATGGGGGGVAVRWKVLFAAWMRFCGLGCFIGIDDITYSAAVNFSCLGGILLTSHSYENAMTDNI